MLFSKLSIICKNLIIIVIGMCFCMVWSKMVTGIVIGLAGIIVLLCLIPLTQGIKSEN